MTSSTGSDDPHSQLNELRTAAVRRIASLVSSFDGIVAAARDVATDDEHDPEGHTIAWERQLVSALLDETRTTLGGIQSAQQRLDDGHYGTCVVCGLEIARARLDALPATPLASTVPIELGGGTDGGRTVTPATETEHRRVARHPGRRRRSLSRPNMLLPGPPALRVGGDQLLCDQPLPLARLSQRTSSLPGCAPQWMTV